LPLLHRTQRSMSNIMAGSSEGSESSSSSRESTPVQEVAKSQSAGVRKPVVIDVAVTSDSICPFCFLGYKKLVAAMEQTKREAKQHNMDLSFS